MNREEWERENETIKRLINDGCFMSAEQGREVGKMIGEGLIVGLTEKRVEEDDQG